MVLGATCAWLLVDRLVVPEAPAPDEFDPVGRAGRVPASTTRPPIASRGPAEACGPSSREAERLFDDAELHPIYEAGTMIGVSIRSVKPESFWEELGVDSGDRIVELDGRPLDSPPRTLDLMNALEHSSRIQLRLLTREGRDRWLSWEAPPSPSSGAAPASCPGVRPSRGS